MANRVASPVDLDNLPPMRKAATFIEAREAAKAFQGQPLTNAKTGMVAVVSRKSLDKMLSASAVTKSTSAAEQSQAVANLDRLFAGALHGLEHADRASDPNLKGIHRFFAPMDTGSATRLIKLTVKEYRHQDNKIYSVEAIDVGGSSESWAPEKSGFERANWTEPTYTRLSEPVRTLIESIRQRNRQRGSVRLISNVR